MSFHLSTHKVACGRDKNVASPVKTAFILGAGLGTRLRPLTENWPKPLLPIRGKPMICHAMEKLTALGVCRFIINTHHAAHAYDEVFPDKIWNGAQILTEHEPVLLDTGGGLKNIEKHLTPADENLLVYNGDIFADLDLKMLAETHICSGSLATLLLRTNPNGNVNFDDTTGAICDMRDRLGNAGTRRCRFTGIYVVSRKFFDEIPHGKIESVVEAFLRVIARGNGEIRGLLNDAGTWRDLGTLADYNAVA